MLLSTRRDTLLEEVRRRGSARFDELAAALDVSGMTVRRDIDLLAGEGLVLKVRGGVTAVKQAPSRQTRHDVANTAHRREKEAIARLAATLVEPGMSVGLSAGSTSWFLARELRWIPEVTVVTNSLLVPDLFAEHDAGSPDVPSPAVVLTGGVRTPADALVGPVAVRSLGNLHCDIVFVSVHGMDPHAGFTMPNLLEAETNRALLASGRRTVVLADHTKWEAVSLTTVADLAAVDVVVVDEGLSEDQAAQMRQHVSDLRLAPFASESAPAGPPRQGL